MIGINIRSFRHFLNSVENFSIREFFTINGNHILGGVAYRQDGHIYIFQHLIGDVICVEDLVKERNKRIGKQEDDSELLNITNTYPRCQRLDAHAFSRIHIPILLLPKTFGEDVDAFLKNNKKLLLGYAHAFNQGPNPIGRYFFAIVPNSPNIVFWAVNNHFKNCVDACLLANILKYYARYGVLTTKINKGTITAYNKFDPILELEDELISLRLKKRANDVINTFNTVQKKVLKSCELTNKEYGVLNKFAQLSLTKRINFIQKVSTIEDRSEIFKQLTLVTNSHFEWNAPSLLEFIDNADFMDCDIKIAQNDLVVLEVKNYESIKHLAKTTNWCISKNKSYWNNYIENYAQEYSSDSSKLPKQYIMFDFSQKEDSENSIIGFTMVGEMITHAHSFTNNSLMGNSSRASHSWLQALTNIHEILSMRGVDYKKLNGVSVARPYKWNKESFLSFFTKKVKRSFFVYLDEGDKLVLSLTSEGAEKFLGDSVVNRMYDYGYSSSDKHFFFVDFSKDETDNTRVLHTPIFNNTRNCEEFTRSMFNIDGYTVNDYTFDSLLVNFDLPYNTISRVETPLANLLSVLQTYDVPLINQKLKSDEIKAILRANHLTTCDKDKLASIFRKSMVEQLSFVLIDAIHVNGYTLSDFLDNHNIISIVSDVMYRMHSAYNNARIKRIPNANDIQAFMNHELSEPISMYVGFFLTIQRLFDYDCARMDVEDFFRNNDSMHHYNKNLTEYVLCRLTDVLFSQPKLNMDAVKRLVIYIDKFSYTQVLEHLLTKPSVEKMISTMSTFCRNQEIRSKLLSLATVSAK